MDLIRNYCVFLFWEFEKEGEVFFLVIDIDRKYLKEKKKVNNGSFGILYGNVDINCR